MLRIAKKRERRVVKENCACAVTLKSSPAWQLLERFVTLTRDDDNTIFQYHLTNSVNDNLAMNSPFRVRGATNRKIFQKGNNCLNTEELYSR